MEYDTAYMFPLSNIYPQSRKLRVKFFTCLHYSVVTKLDPCVKVESCNFEVSITGELVLCALCISIMLFAAVPPSSATSLSLFHRLEILDIASYHHNQILR